jgi:hypothetical protein
MSREVPSYILAASVQATAIRYTWDDWNVRSAEQPLDIELIRVLETLPLRTTVAYAIGSAEWLVYRFLPLVQDNAPWAFLEASWAMMIDDHYTNYGDATGWAEYSQHDWAGAIKGPVKSALLAVESGLEELAWHAPEHPPNYLKYMARLAGQINALTQHVLPDATAYRQWSGQVIERLKAVYRLIEGDEIGDVVPPQAVDPSFPFKPERTEELVNVYLKGLDYTKNPFLSSPDAMTEVIEDDQPFVGTPYVFDIATDRTSRHARAR